VRASRTLVAAFAGMGAQASVVPALLPAWSQRAGDGVLAAVPAMFAGLFVGVLAAVPVLARFGPGRVLRGSTAAQALALVGLALAGRGTTAGSVRAVVVVAAVSGVAFGVTESATSLAARAGAGTDRRLGGLLAVSAATAAVLPVLAFAATRAGVADAALLVAAIPATVVALRPAVGTRSPASPVAPAPSAVPAGGTSGTVTSAVRPPGGPGREPGPDRQPEEAAVTSTASAPSGPPGRGGLVRVLAPAGVALALYVGVETVLSGWSAVLVHDLLGADPALAALGASAFWVLMSAGRAWGARTRGGVMVRALVATGLFVCAAAGGRAPVAVVAACAATVLVVAPAYPRLLGAALDRLDGPSAVRWTGPLVAAGAAGGSLLPALVLRLGPPSSAPTFVSAATACLALALASWVLMGRPAAARPAPAVPDRRAAPRR